MKDRIFWIDIAKGIAIFLTVLGHCYPESQVITFIFSFHMPIFFILSGYTLKETSKDDLVKVTIKDFKRLYLPVFIVAILDFFADFIKYFLFSTKSIPSILNIVIGIAWGNCNPINGIKSVHFLWFLVALFYSRLFFRIILLNFKKYREIVLLFFAYIFSLIGFRIAVPQSLDLIFICAFFIDVGYVFKKFENEIRPKENIVGVVLIFVWFILISITNQHIDFAQRSYSPLVILIALAGSYCVIMFLKAFENTSCIRKPISFLGRNSLYLLCIHELDNNFGKLYNFVDPFKDSISVYIYFSVRISVDILILLIFVFVKNKINRLKNDLFLKKYSSV